MTVKELAGNVNGNLDSGIKTAFPIEIITTILTVLLQNIIEKKCPASAVRMEAKRHSIAAKRMIRRAIRSVKDHPAVNAIDIAIAKAVGDLSVGDISKAMKAVPDEE